MWWRATLRSTVNIVAETAHELIATPRAGRVDKWVAEALGLSRNRIAALLEAGHVTVDGEAVSRARKLRGGELVRVVIPPSPDSRLEAQDIPVPILYEDDAVMIVDKPAGLVVHPAKGHPDGTLVNALFDKLIRTADTLSAWDCPSAGQRNQRGDVCGSNTAGLRRSHSSVR